MKTLTLLGFAILIFGCTRGARQTMEPMLEQTQWQLVELGGNPPAATEPGRKAHLQLLAAEKRAVGSSGCNRLSGSYERNGGSLRFSKIAGTRMMCPEPLMQQEAAFTNALEASTSWQITDGKLALRDAAGAVLARFAPKSTP